MKTFRARSRVSGVIEHPPVIWASGGAPSALTAYSRWLWHGGDAAARPACDPRLLAAFAVELARIHGPGPLVDAAIGSLKRHRVLGTKTHVVPAHGPVFLAADHLLLFARPRDAVAVVGAWSGLPFNGNARPDRLGFSLAPEALLRPGTPTWTRFGRSRRDRARANADEPGQHWLPLVGSRHQHSLVYRHPIPPNLGRLIDDLQPAFARLLAAPDRCEDYPTWALRSCVSIERAALAESALACVDLNRVAAHYLAEVLRDAYHPLAELMRAPAPMLGDALHEPWFFERDEAGRLRPLWLADNGLRGRAPDARWPADAIADALDQGHLCPGLFPTYSALIVFGGLRCVGGQRQLAYLGRFARCWRALRWDFADERRPSLLGRLFGRDAAPLHAVDLACRGETVADVVDLDRSAACLYSELASDRGQTTP